MGKAMDKDMGYGVCKCMCKGMIQMCVKGMCTKHGHKVWVKGMIEIGVKV